MLAYRETVSLQWNRDFSRDKAIRTVYIPFTPAITRPHNFFFQEPSPTSPHLMLGCNATPPITGTNREKWLEDLVTIGRGQQGRFPRSVTPGPGNGENRGRALCAPIDDDLPGQMCPTPQWSDVVSKNSRRTTTGEGMTSRASGHAWACEPGFKSWFFEGPSRAQPVRPRAQPRRTQMKRQRSSAGHYSTRGVP